MQNNFVLITGASGFLGKVIFSFFKKKGYSIVTIGRKKITESDFHLLYDITSPNLRLLNFRFTKVVHVAGKAHMIPKTESEKKEFFEVNFEGTKNLLNALNQLEQKPEIFVNISTVAVYGKSKGDFIKENDRGEPNTPYGISKLEAERLVEKWAKENDIDFLNLRLPLVVGENPPGNLGDMKAAISNGSYPRILRNKARKSIVLASDIASLIEKVEGKSGTYNLTDEVHPTFEDIENAIQKRVNQKIKLLIPKFVINIMAKIGDLLQKITKKDMPISSARLEKLTSNLTFDDTKAKKELDWNPNPVLPFIEKHL